MVLPLTLRDKIMKYNEFKVRYGSDETRETAFVCEHNGVTWYGLCGSLNINATRDEVTPDCDVEALSDVDNFEANAPLGDVEQFEAELTEYLGN